MNSENIFTTKVNLDCGTTCVTTTCTEVLPVLLLPALWYFLCYYYLDCATTCVTTTWNVVLPALLLPSLWYYYLCCYYLQFVTTCVTTNCNVLLPVLLLPAKCYYLCSVPSCAKTTCVLYSCFICSERPCVHYVGLPGLWRPRVLALLDCAVHITWAYLDCGGPVSRPLPGLRRHHSVYLPGLWTRAYLDCGGPVSSLGRYVFGSEISYNKAPPRLPGLGC